MFIYPIKHKLNDLYWSVYFWQNTLLIIEHFPQIKMKSWTLFSLTLKPKKESQTQWQKQIGTIIDSVLENLVVSQLFEFVERFSF